MLSTHILIILIEKAFTTQKLAILSFVKKCFFPLNTSLQNINIVEILYL